MRRILTWGLVAAVAGLGLAAGIDAVRGEGAPEQTVAADPERPTSTEPEPPEDMFAEARADLQAAGVPEGRLIYADEDCRNYVLTMPDLRPAGPRPDTSVAAGTGRSSAASVATIGSPSSPDGSVRAECKGGWLSLLSDVFGNPKPERPARARGCGAAWKPDGTVTFVQNGSVRRFARCPGDRALAPLRCSRPMLTRAQLARQLPGVPWNGYALSIKELHWLDDQRFAAIMRARSMFHHCCKMFLMVIQS